MMLYNVITYRQFYQWWQEEFYVMTLKCLLHVQITMTYLLTITKQMAINQNEFR